MGNEGAPLDTPHGDLAPSLPFRVKCTVVWICYYIQAWPDACMLVEGTVCAKCVPHPTVQKCAFYPLAWLAEHDQLEQG